MLKVKGILESENSFFIFQSGKLAKRAPKFPFSAHSKIMAAFNKDSNIGIENPVRYGVRLPPIFMFVDLCNMIWYSSKN